MSVEQYTHCKVLAFQPNVFQYVWLEYLLLFIIATWLIIINYNSVALLWQFDYYLVIKFDAS